jgi:crotonobetainyl-CoA:carnitine CoA-transferase CaiB-like acyl-CoA transferase
VHPAVEAPYPGLDGELRPAPAPRFGRGVPARPSPAVPPGTQTEQVLAEAALSRAVIDALRRGAAACVSMRVAQPGAAVIGA